MRVGVFMHVEESETKGGKEEKIMKRSIGWIVGWTNIYELLDH